MGELVVLRPAPKAEDDAKKDPVARKRREEEERKRRNAFVLRSYRIKSRTGK
jgi:hypothetical protein